MLWQWWMIRNALVSIVLVWLTLLVPTSTQARNAARQRLWHVSLGAGAAVVPDYEGSEDYEPFPMPFARVVFDDVFELDVQGNMLRLSVLPTPVFQAGLALQFRRERDDVRNDAVDSLRDVDAALEVGAFLGLTIGRWHTRLLAVQDVADAHDGRVFTLTTAYTLPPIEALTLTLGLSGTYADDDYMETYFSIDTNNAARSGLPRFEAEAGLKDVGAHLTLRYQESRHWSALAIFKYARLLGDAADSPIVDDVGSENQFFAGLIAIYTF